VHRLIEHVLEPVLVQPIGAAALQHLAHPDVLQARQGVDEPGVPHRIGDDPLQQRRQAARVLVAGTGVDVALHDGRGWGEPKGRGRA
jgi:hypothetical protein